MLQTREKYVRGFNYTIVCPILFVNEIGLTQATRHTSKETEREIERDREQRDREREERGLNDTFVLPNPFKLHT